MPSHAGVEFVQLTGQPRATMGLDVVSFVPDKRFQLISYLAYTDDWVGRERVAFLFWPDTDSANSRQNLRGLLQRARALPCTADMETTPQQLRWRVDSDVRRYREAMRNGQDAVALAAYNGPLLLGMDSDDAGEFGEWLEIEREGLQAEWRGLALRTVNAARAQGYREAVLLLRRLLDADPLDEEAVRAYMGAAARAGRPEEGLTVYRAFAARLADDMGLDPTAQTVAAFEALAAMPQALQLEPAALDGVPDVAFSAVPPKPEPKVSTSVRPERAPTPGTTFFGREKERADLVERLRDPHTRLVTVLGPGGVGKTRLAISVAEHLKQEFADGVAYVALDAVASAETVPTALAAALGLRLSGGDPLPQVVRALRDARLLLVLDNFEHVLAAVPVVLALLDGCPGVVVLTTSRQRLGLMAAEWLYPIEGLPWPGSPPPADTASYPAVALLVERARRVRPSFELEPADVPYAVELCALTRGMPLAIELAAVWLRVLPIQDVVGDLRRNLDLLTTDAPDQVPRHRSVRATFEQSWELLGERERDVLRRLAVFHAPFKPEAARFVADASHVVLAALVDKSLLRLDRDGHYDLHPLLSMYASEKLEQDQDARASAEERHASFFLRFLRERTDRARGATPAAALREIDAELSEVLGAAQRAEARGNTEDLIAFAQLLAIDTGYLQARGYGPEVVALLEAAAAAAAARAARDPAALHSAHVLMGRLGDVYATHQGDNVKGLEAYRSAAEFAKLEGDLAHEAVLWSLVGVMRFRIESGGVNADLDRALEMARATGGDLALATVLEHRGFVLASMEAFEEANDLFRESLDVVDRLAARQGAEPLEINRRRFYGLLNLGETEQRQDRFEAALEARMAAMRIAMDSGNQVWVAHASGELGAMYESIGERTTASTYLDRAIELYRANHVTAEADRVAAFMEAHGYVVPVPADPA